MSSVLRFELRLAEASEWFRVFDARDGTLVVAHGGAVPALSAPVRVDVVVGNTGPRVIFRGEVLVNRDGATVVAIGVTERIKLNYLNGYVRGGFLDLRSKRRIPLRLPVTYGGVAGPVETHTRDINEEGVFILTEEPLPEDSELNVLLRLPDRATPLSLLGVVTHTVVPEDEDVPGMGVVFEHTAATREQLRASVDALERRFLSNDVPEDMLQ